MNNDQIDHVLLLSKQLKTANAKLEIAEKALEKIGRVNINDLDRDELEDLIFNAEIVATKLRRKEVL